MNETVTSRDDGGMCAEGDCDITMALDGYVAPPESRVPIRGRRRRRAANLGDGAGYGRTEIPPKGGPRPLVPVMGPAAVRLSTRPMYDQDLVTGAQPRGASVFVVTPRAAGRPLERSWHASPSVKI